MIKLLLLALAATTAFPQTDPELERRVAELEKKIRQLDPSFVSSQEQDFRERLAALEKKVDALLETRATPAASPPPVTETPLEPLTPVTVTGPRSGEEERRLPVAGYMDFHFNKPLGDPGQLDFHRFVLLFGHSFTDRIKFWSELEVEHGFVE